MAAGALARMSDTLRDVTVDPAAMRANMSELLMAEAVSVKLAASIGKTEAHAVVQRASRAPDFKAALAADGRVADLEEVLAPENYLGSSDAFIDAVLKRREKP